jgi:hypothetical protein
MKRGLIGPIDVEIVAGVRDGLIDTDSLRNPALEQHTDQQRATDINIMVQATFIAEQIKDLESYAREIAEVTKMNPEVALHCLGGEAQARDIMGDVATDSLLRRIERQRGDGA